MLTGVDISHWQNNDQFLRCHNFADFIIMKASEGGITKDKRFKDRMKKCIYAGKNVGAYHFWKDNVAAVTQAKNFIEAIKDTYKIVKDYHGGKLPYLLALDVENCKINKYDIDSFLIYVYRELGQLPVIYLNLSDYNKYYKNDDRYKYWIASWSRDSKEIFKDDKIILHQYESDELDFNKFRFNDWRF